MGHNKNNRYVTYQLKLFLARALYLKKNFLMFIFEREGETERQRDRQTDHEWGKGKRERETQNPKQSPGSMLSAQSLMQGSNSQTMKS